MTTGSCGASGHPNVSRMPVVDLWQNNLDTPGVQGPAHDYNNTCKGSKEGKEIVRHCLQCIKSTLLQDLEPHEVSASVIEAGGRPHLLSIGEINELLHD